MGDGVVDAGGEVEKREEEKRAADRRGFILFYKIDSGRDRGR